MQLKEIAFILLLIFNLWTYTDSFLKWMEADLSKMSIKSMRDIKNINALKVVSLTSMIVIAVVKVYDQLYYSKSLNLDKISIYPDPNTISAFNLKLSFTLPSSIDTLASHLIHP